VREHSIAFSASLLFHVIVVALFLHVPFDQYVKPKLMVLDFSLEKGRTIAGGKDVNHESGTGNRETQIANRETQTTNREPQIENREQNIKRNLTAEASLAKQNNVDTIASDPAGQVMIRGEMGPMGAKANNTGDKNISVGGGSRNLPAVSGGMRVIDYGKDGVGAEDFPFVGETLNRRFKDRYPDRARRMGWEGEVRVSFVISEDGVVHEVEIVKSSGRSIFDEHAKEILAKTTFDRRLPYPLKIENRRVIYKLQ
jgi:TonB family protein